MKRRDIFFLIVTLVICSLTVGADTRSGQILAAVGAKVKGYKAYAVEFSMTTGPGTATVKGTFIVSGDRYYLSAAGSEVYCDGKTKYEVNPTDKEVLIDKVDAADKGILSNPTKVFDFPDNLFSHVYAGSESFAGKKCDNVTLKPKEHGSPIEKVTLMVNAETGFPAGIVYKMGDVSQPVTVEITAIKPLDAVPASTFAFDRAKYKSYEIIDFR